MQACHANTCLRPYCCLMASTKARTCADVETELVSGPGPADTPLGRGQADSTGQVVVLSQCFWMLVDAWNTWVYKVTQSGTTMAATCQPTTERSERSNVSPELHVEFMQGQQPLAVFTAGSDPQQP